MRVTRELLLNLAREQAAKMAAKDTGIQCVYLIGSLLTESPFLGGVTDIDLVCVHDRAPAKEREIVRINSEVHFDVLHFSDESYSPPRKLRTDPWIGGGLDKSSLALFERYHWFDFTRASASAHYWQTENVVLRARGFAASARQCWQTLMDENPQALKRTQLYLDGLSATANALAILTGAPLTTRRFLLDLPGRVEPLELPEFTGAFVGLFSSAGVSPQQLEEWQTQWLASYDALKANSEIPCIYQPTRRSYYEKAVSVLSADHPAAALWIILSVWSNLAAYLPKTETLYRQFQAMLRALELDVKGLPARLAGLDALLDNAENTIDAWQEMNA